MADLIDRQADDLISRKWLIECVEEGWIKFDTEKDKNKFIHLVRDTAPTVEAEPVRHGRWGTDGMPMDDGEYLMTRCTVCGTAYEYGHNENYCGYCGARMDGEQIETD